MSTIALLVLSNVFMTIAWYGHLKHADVPLWKAIVVSWGIAFFEYCLMVPANLMGYGKFTGFQLKVIKEIITLVVFTGFAVIYLREPVRWNYMVAFVLILAAVWFAFLPAPPPRPAAP